MKVLVIGNGGREHALAWKLLQSKKINKLVCVPGNGGTATMPGCENLPLAVDDFAGISEYAVNNDIPLVIVGPEVPLAQGITDYLQNQGLMVFGPNKEGAQIEASKAWAKALMTEAGVPTAKSAVFTEAAPAKAYIQSEGAPIVIKADGLAAGKGVTVAETIAQAEAAIEAIFQGQFGSAGSSVVIEECLVGQEVSILALTDGLTIRPLLPAQDHKRVGEGDTGENTGGMGAYAPAPIATPQLMARVQTEVLERTIHALQARGIDYRGILYAGLMISPDGDFRVLEFNCRFGDPETQVILPMLETPLEDLILACIEQRLEDMPPIAWKQGAAATVVAASGGYPGEYAKGKVITGLAAAETAGATVFHAGTKLNAAQEVVTDGGRVLNVTGLGENFQEALAQAYAGIENIQFAQMYYRRDIGYRVLG
ncbi:MULTISPECIES: phosphoribosylamine--glycine ligase [Aphanizomenon]|uniref:Phosphoribosylamine--glycine ligase n=1 Tax=Aphanizomenon flos-aquae FACHB-1249 TaxID=2692889 RepID=A0ABR8IQB2_APHFL|nr:MULTISPECIES: phosphoribosylamine--glycine ligase [Aphanizomenon]MBD2390916.1 phosphoribosylamine--glycine ligase [Aphanizomenon flos-aquae FACHB-1171]MBD2556834.1 phosphoribosylamine--glycine ligase [Aphanizomenon flos-aquae FACHB-1290]MBD2631614.1 phosphoribosylamine--glycine ligase [Aphanizomenon sp. FACHB-1399]MBD2657609.1 phosphoribosylamine--glycine ligase [Aphanizomenon flos-aquae FACHB-1265]MBD2673660.1 phosphoribosylamine--glycine ligase [Aphanizomenon flos-aquae FACHB-1416]MBD268